MLPLILGALLAAPALRLLLLSSRTRQSPELWAGLFFLGVAIGIPLRLVGARLSVSDGAQALIFNGIGHAAFAAGTCALFLFVRRVFHPAQAWASGAAGAGVTAIVATTGLLFASGDLNQESSLSVLLVNTSRVAPILWAFAESTRYHMLMSRRAALGLGDPVVANRFLLWSLWTGALGLIPGLAALLRALKHLALALGLESDRTVELQQTAVTVLGAFLLFAAPIAIVALWLSFFPPRRYLDRLVARGKTAAA